MPGSQGTHTRQRSGYPGQPILAGVKGYLSFIKHSGNKYALHTYWEPGTAPAQGGSLVSRAHVVPAILELRV